MRYEGDVYRPPGEWRSYLLQVTIGCSYNACTFCGMYKEKKYRVRPMSEIMEDIQMAKEYYGDVERVFLCDGDAIAMPTEDLLRILKKLYETFPGLQRVTIYAGARAALEKTPEELKALRQAGLKRAYLGVESGDDLLLRQVCKGVSAEEMLRAGTKLIEAGIDLWAIVLIGLAGRGERSREHAAATGALISKMKPRHLSALTYTPVPGTKLFEQIQAGEFTVLTAAEAMEETKILLEHLDTEYLHFTSNHASNYLPIKGTLPQDKERLIEAIDSALRGECGIRSERARRL